MKYLLIGLVVLIASCGRNSYQAEVVQEVEERPNIAFTSFEDITLPRFDSLKNKFQLDTIFKGETDEFKRILLIRNWIRRHISINDFGDPYPGNDHPAGIIDAARQGQGFHCGHYMVVQNALMNAYGYVTRCLGSGPGLKTVADGHHGMNEIWVNKLGKWVLSDAKFDHHFEKEGIPLSALEVRQEYLKNKAADIDLVKGPNRSSIKEDSLADRSGKFLKRDKEWFARWYTWIEWDRRNSRFSEWPEFHSALNVYSDDFAKSNTWIWDGKPHWAYGTDQMNLVEDRKHIEWTPNTTNAKVSLVNNTAEIQLHSTTPNFEEYQVRLASEGKWQECDSIFRLELSEQQYELSFRAVNKAGVSGPITIVRITAK